MPDQHLPFTLVRRLLESGASLGELLHHPELSTLDTDAEHQELVLTHNVLDVLRQLPPAELHRRLPASAAEPMAVTLDLAPPARSKAWLEPVSLTCHGLRWRHPPLYLAWFPDLEVEVHADSPEGLEEKARRELLGALRRRRLAGSLEPLVWLQRTTGIEVAEREASASIQTAKQRAVKAWQEAKEPESSVLEQVADDLTRRGVPQAWEVDDLVQRLLEALTASPPTSVLLIGPPGSGKTAVFLELVRRRRQLGLGHTPFYTSSGSRLVAGMTGFGMWQERCQKVWREASSKKAILHLGSLVELMEVGKHEGNAQGIAGFLRPYLARGDLLAVLECTPEQLPVLEREDPQLIAALHPIRVEEPSPERGRLILRHVAAHVGRGRMTLDEAGLDTIERLHRRYATYSAWPGRPLRFLRAQLEDLPPDRVLSTSDVTAAFSRETGLPRVLLDDSVPLRLDETRAWLSSRVIGQPEAVDRVSDLLAAVKAGLTRPRRPIASLLFIGPTGVGKTQMARSLAELLFQSADRLTRFDMSEYAEPHAVQRLIGGVFGAEGLLTAKVREQPFSVLLLDELEKAHPLFFDLLLQVLGEGRLTDAGGRVADFSNAVVIMTSNLGAESFAQGVAGFGSRSGRREAADHFQESVRRFLRPEIYNRLDRIIPFAPLDEETVHRIARRELELIAARDGIRLRGVRLTLDEAVAGKLARQGYAPRYGARPLKRAVERELLAPLAERLNRYSAEVPVSASIRLEAERLVIQVAGAQDGGRRTAGLAGSAEADVATQARDLRREVQQVERSSSWLELRNLHTRLERRETLRKKHPGQRAPEEGELAGLPALRGLLEAQSALVKQVLDLEDRAMLALYGSESAERPAAESQTRPGSAPDLRAALLEAEYTWDGLLLRAYARRIPHPDVITLAVFGENPAWLLELARAFIEVARERGDAVDLYPLTLEHATVLPAPKRDKVEKVDQFLAYHSEGLIGLLLHLRGPGVFPAYSLEAGLHLLKEGDSTQSCGIFASDQAPVLYTLPKNIARKGSLKDLSTRRTYHLATSEAEDTRLRKRLQWRGRRIATLLGPAIAQTIQSEVRAWLELPEAR